MDSLLFPLLDTYQKINTQYANSTSKTLYFSPVFTVSFTKDKITLPTVLRQDPIKSIHIHYCYSEMNIKFHLKRLYLLATAPSVSNVCV